MGRTTKKLLADIKSVDIEEELLNISEDYDIFKELIPGMLECD